MQLPEAATLTGVAVPWARCERLLKVTRPVGVTLELHCGVMCSAAPTRRAEHGNPSDTITLQTPDKESDR
jgi:hypothetical protein